MTATDTQRAAEIETTRNPATPCPRPKTRTRKRNRFNSAVRLFRRTHLYFGLLLVPFVLLYGLTAIFFNHPTWLDSRSETTVNETDLFSAHPGFPIDAMAEDVRRELEEQMEEPIEITGAPVFNGDFLLETREDEKRIRVRIDPSTLASTTQVTALASSDEPRRFPERLDDEFRERIDLLKSEAENRTALEDSSIRSAPDIEFTARVGDEQWEIAYDLRNGAITERRVGELRREFNLRSFLMRLHVSRGYPDEVGLRSFWGGIVDVTAALMIFWAGSGVVMWWQMKPLRFTGAFALGGGILMAGLLAWGMYVALYL